MLQEHFLEVIRNQEFLLLSADEVAKLLASDDLNVSSEEIIFHVRKTNYRNFKFTYLDLMETISMYLNL